MDESQGRLRRSRGADALARPAMHGRYTHWVERLGRFATALLIVLLAAGPAFASVCEAGCVPAAATIDAAAPDAHSHGHHHQAPAHAAADGQQRAGGHDHHGSDSNSGSGAVEGAQSGDPQVGRFVGRDCCTDVAPLLRPSLTASRLDTDLLPDPQVAAVMSVVRPDVRARESDRRTDASLTRLSSTRTPLVLRI